MKTDKGRLQVLMVEGLDFRVPGLESFVCRVYAAGLIRIHDCFRVQSRPLMDAVMLDHIRCGEGTVQQFERLSTESRTGIRTWAERGRGQAPHASEIEDAFVSQLPQAHYLSDRGSQNVEIV
jgi:hypothetical protein